VVWVEAGDWSLENIAYWPGLETQKQDGRQWGIRCSNSSIGELHAVIGNQGIRELCKDMPDTMMIRLVEHVRGRIIREVDYRLMWGLEPTTQGELQL